MELATGSLRLVSLNIAHGRGLSPYQGFASEAAILRQLGRIRKLLDRLDPDVVCLQEVDEGSHWNRHINLLEPLRDDEHLRYAFMGVHNRRAGNKSLAYGNALLSRYPILSAEVVAFGTRTLGEKGFIYAEIETPLGPLPVVNVHLDYASRRGRLEQVGQLMRFIRDMEQSRSGNHPGPAVICGDFNSSHGARGDAVGTLFNELDDLHGYEVLPQKGLTFPAPLPLRCLDFMLVPKPWHCRSCQIIRAMVSDHRPVCIDIVRTNP